MFLVHFWCTKEFALSLFFVFCFLFCFVLFCFVLFIYFLKESFYLPIKEQKDCEQTMPDLKFFFSSLSFIGCQL